MPPESVIKVVKSEYRYNDWYRIWKDYNAKTKNYRDNFYSRENNINESIKNLSWEKYSQLVSGFTEKRTREMEFKVY